MQWEISCRPSHSTPPTAAPTVYCRLLQRVIKCERHKGVGSVAFEVLAIFREWRVDQWHAEGCTSGISLTPDSRPVVHWGWEKHWLQWHLVTVFAVIFFMVRRLVEHPHKSKSDSLEASSLINHEGTPDFCSCLPNWFSSYVPYERRERTNKWEKPIFFIFFLSCSIVFYFPSTSFNSSPRCVSACIKLASSV